MSADFRNIARAVAWRSVHNFLTNKALLIPALIFPLFFFASFAGGLSAVGGAHVRTSRVFRALEAPSIPSANRASAMPKPSRILPGSQPSISSERNACSR